MWVAKKASIMENIVQRINLLEGLGKRGERSTGEVSVQL